MSSFKMLSYLRISERSFPSAFPTRAVSASLTSLFRYVTRMHQLSWLDRSNNVGKLCFIDAMWV